MALLGVSIYVRNPKVKNNFQTLGILPSKVAFRWLYNLGNYIICPLALSVHLQPSAEVKDSGTRLLGFDQYTKMQALKQDS